MFDVHNPSSFEAVERFRQDFNEKSEIEDVHEYPNFLIANKIDLDREHERLSENQVDLLTAGFMRELLAELGVVYGEKYRDLTDLCERYLELDCGVSTKKATEYAKQHNMEYHEISVQEGTNIDAIFEKVCQKGIQRQPIRD